MLDKKGTKDSNPWIGCTSLSKINTVNEYLNSKGKPQHCRFVWSDFNDSTKVCLYALKLGRDKGSLLSGNDFDSAKSIQDKPSKYWHVDFSFKKPVIKVWSAITKQNIGKSIAIVIDNRVICAPVIRSGIDNGKCQITGNFTESEVKLFAAIGNYGELPVSFTVIK
jgi:preprotein translocase subunit SecD